MSPVQGLLSFQHDTTHLQDIPRDTSTTTHPSDTAKYGRRQEEGTIRQRWLTDLTIPNCPIQSAHLTLADLVHDGWDYTKETIDQPQEIKSDPISATLPHGNTRYRMQRVKKMCRLGGADHVNKHFNLICRGAIIAKNIYRFDGPYWSQIAQAMYERHFPMETIQYVYFTNLDNADTITAVRDHVYPGNGLTWPPVGDAGFKTWEFGEPEYSCLLGTRLGKAVVYLLLGAFPRGTWCVARVATWCWDSELQMRFDVEEI
ncbi:hypothetical protein N7492_004416 [Penicillium capsulatum]|uniref:Uncharacterized protein n=1 Tax=Penicillium capsulatum TaxID=69766 RepID=A0A9W9I9X8_9EURO|nr:hypothetical protein N7492_004416 [Penicillium capsulatum]